MLNLAKHHEQSALAESDLAALQRKLRTVVLGTMLISTCMIALAGYAQSALWGLAFSAIVGTNAICLIVLAISWIGYPRFASGFLIIFLIIQIGRFAIYAGGVRSPGISAGYIYIFLTGLLLGGRAAIAVAISFVCLGLALALTEVYGILPKQTVYYTPTTIWALQTLYTAILLLLVRLWARDLSTSSQQAREENKKRGHSDRKLSLALDAGNIGTWEYTPNAVDFIADERAYAMFGLKRPTDGRMIFADWLAMIDPEERYLVRATFDRVSDGGVPESVEYSITTPDGSRRHIFAAGSTMLDTYGRVERVVGFFLDWTQRKEATMERERLVWNLGERVKELRLLHEAAQLLRDRRFDSTLLESLVSRMPQAWQWPDVCAARISYKNLVAATPNWRETSWRQSCDFSTDEGHGNIEVVYLEPQPAFDEGPFLAEERALINSLAEMLASYIQREESEQRRITLEAGVRQSQKLEALGTLAGGIAHDFNSFLAAIDISARLGVNTASLDSVERRYFEQITQASARAKQLIKRILLFSQQQQGEFSTMPIEPILTEVQDLLKLNRPEDVVLEVICPSDLPLIYADPTQIHQVILNLGNNAFYAMKETGGLLRIAVNKVPTLADGSDDPQAVFRDGLRISVSDTGTGIPPEIIERIFEPFFSTKSGEGTGLGLSVVHGIIKDHGGQITVSSQLGEGTDFEIFLPIHADSKTANQKSTPANKNMHILYVDDEEVLGKMLKNLIEAIGHSCTTHSDPHAALEILHTTLNNVDMLLIDLDMPKMHGLELLKSVRAIQPTLPVGILSSQISENYLRAYEQENVVWVQKPPSIAALRIILGEIDVKQTGSKIYLSCPENIAS